MPYNIYLNVMLKRGKNEASAYLEYSSIWFLEMNV